MFKVDLFRALRFEQNRLSFNPRVSWEQKIGQSPFSVEVEGELGADGTRYVNNGDVDHLWDYKVGASVQPRYYFLQKRQIAWGKSGNNLNGLYLGVRSGIEYRQGSAQGWLNGIAGPVYLNNDVRSITSNHALISGFQYRLFEHGFVDWQLGCGYGQTRSDVTPDNQPAFKENRQGLDLSIQFRLGLAF